MSAETIVLSFAGTVFLLLVAVLAWIGSRLHTRMDSLTLMLDVKLTSVSASLSNIERDVRQELAVLDRRVALIEGADGGEQRHKRG